MISQYDLQKLTDLILENRDALNSLHTATTEQKMQAAYEFANTDRELFTFVELLAARDEQTTAAETDGWIEWRGGECPLVCDAPVEVKTRSGIYAGWAGDFYWSDNVVAYRVVR